MKLFDRLSGLLHWVMYNLWYTRRPPWDTGETPPELIDFVALHPSGRALDLGCGTGTNAIFLAQKGWQVTAIDFVASALAQAHKKAASTNVLVDFRRGDVTDLKGLHPPFDLILDIGCFHSLTQTGRYRYIQNVERLLAEKGSWLLYSFLSPGPETRAVGLAASDLDILAQHFEEASRQDSSDSHGELSTWLLLQRRG